MAAQSIVNSISIASGWVTTTLSDMTDLYLIAVKGDNKGSTDVIDPKDVKQIYIEMGIDSGITNKPVTIGHVVLDFSTETSTDETINKKTAIRFIQNAPLSFMIKVVGFSDGVTVYRDGTVNIGLNISKVR